jgi:hypothetical protein
MQMLTNFFGKAGGLGSGAGTGVASAAGTTRTSFYRFLQWYGCREQQLLQPGSGRDESTNACTFFPRVS